ncbi:hypothetical protein, partial [Hominiventricola aquisgranensis]
IKITSKLSNFILHQFGGLHKLWDTPDLSAYANRAFEKLKMYASCQVIPTINLLTTYETAYHPLDCEQVENIIKETFL